MKINSNTFKHTTSYLINTKSKLLRYKSTKGNYNQ